MPAPEGPQTKTRGAGIARRTPTATHWGSYEVVAKDGRVIAVEPVAFDEAPSLIGSGMASAHRDPSRIEAPMIRKGWLENGPGPAEGRRGRDPFVAISWDDALDLTSQELSRIRDQHGNQAIYAGSYGWASAGRFHHAQSQVHRFLRQFGGYTDSLNSYSVGAMEVILPHVIGGAPTSIWQRGPTLEEIARSGELIVSFGGMAPKNAAVDPGGVSRHLSPGLQQLCRDAGVRFVNVSPLRTDSAGGLEAEWLMLRPGTDVALMLALAHEIVSSGRHDRDFLSRCCVGFERFGRYLLGSTDGVPKNAEWGASITEIPAETIRSLADRICTHRTVINVSWSIQRMAHGEHSHWMAAVLSAISGSFGLPGGGFAAGIGTAQIGVRRGRHPVASLPQGPNPVTTAIPVARVADMLLGPGTAYDYDGGSHTYPDIRLVYWAGGNPFHHHQDLHRLVGAWQRPDTVVVHEPWWNANARFADIVLPIATSLERNDLGAGALDLVLTAMHKAVEPPDGVLTDYEIFSELAARLGFADSFTEGRTADEWVRHLYEQTRTSLGRIDVSLPPFDEFWATGKVETPPPPDPTSGSFSQLRKDPDRFPFDTPSGKLEIFSEAIDSFGYEDCPGHPTWMEPEEWLGAPLVCSFPLHLVSNQPARRLHSQYDNGSHSRAGKVKGHEPALMHPADAASRGINDGDIAKIYNDRGACLVGIRISDEVRERVIVLSTGAWFDPVDPGVAGTVERHGNPNVLTSDRGTSRLAQGPAPGTTLVEVERVDDINGAEPRPFEPPAIARGLGPVKRAPGT